MVNPTGILNDLRRARSWLSWAAAIGLVPWIIYLAHSLPRHYDTGHWCRRRLKTDPVSTPEF